MSVITQEIPAGVITMWSLASHSSRDGLAVALAAESLGQFVSEVPAPRRMAGMMADALRELFPGRDGHYVAAVKSKGKGRAKFWSVKRETHGEEDVEWQTACRVKVVEHETDPTLDEYEVTYGWTSDIEGKINEALERQKGLITAEQLSTFMVAAVRCLPGAISIRPSGGIYALTDAPSKEFWSRFARAVGDCGHGRQNKVYKVEYTVNEGSIEMIRDALIDEAAAFAAQLEAELMQTDEKLQLGSRALKNRAKMAEGMLGRVEHLERALGGRVQDAHDMIERVRLLCAQASMLTSVSVG